MIALCGNRLWFKETLLEDLMMMMMMMMMIMTMIMMMMMMMMMMMTLGLFVERTFLVAKWDWT